MLSLCRRDLDDFCWNRPPGIVWFGSLWDCLDSIHILPDRSPCGRRRLKSLDPSIASFRCPNGVSAELCYSGTELTR